jgi:outer membrane protein OmpA-like peptidoglycan-associated protein
MLPTSHCRQFVAAALVFGLAACGGPSSRGSSPSSIVRGPAKVITGSATVVDHAIIPTTTTAPPSTTTTISPKPPTTLPAPPHWELSAEVLFETDSAVLLPDASRIVRDIANELFGTTGVVEIRGHTDSRGSDTWNAELSQARAEAVGAVLADVIGGQRIRTFGVGASEPKIQDESSQGRAVNRRVEITLIAG